MGLKISECGTIGEYKTRTTSENGGDYIYVNKFNHSLVFSDNGTKSLMSEPVVQEDNTAWYIDLGSSEAESARLGSSDHPFANVAEMAFFVPRNTNGHVIKVYIKAASSSTAVSLDGFENLEIYGWGNSTYVPVLSLSNCKNIKVAATDTASASDATDISVASVVNCTNVTFTRGTTNVGYINVAGPITNSSVTSVANVIINTTAAEGVPVFDIKQNSSVAFASVDASATKLIKVDNSEFDCDSVTSCNVTAINGGDVRLYYLYTSKASDGKTLISADNLSNIAVKEYAKETSENETYRDKVVVAASNNSRISMLVANEQLIPVHSVTAATGSYITISTLTGYLVEGQNEDPDTVVNPTLTANMASTIIYNSADIDQEHTIEPAETETTNGRINAVSQEVDLSNYVEYNASTVSNS